MMALLLACVLQICSDDPVLGNERVSFDPPVGGGAPEWYEARIDGATAACHSVVAPATSIPIAGTLCAAYNDIALIRVRACNGQGCSEFSNPVEFLPWACLRSNPDCEEPCYLGAPRRFPHLPAC